MQILQHPIHINLELTTKCPLNCPQCYVSLNTGKVLDREIALARIRDAASAGVKFVNLSGGETLCYPHLDDLLRECRAMGICSSVALSGALVTRERLEQIIAAGVNNIFISLNGSTEEINRKTRDGYALAIRALRLLQEMAFPSVCINWVMHRSNADDFPQMIRLASRYGVKVLTILGFKPNSNNDIPEYPTKEQMYAVADTVRQYEGNLILNAEFCFSPLRALSKECFFGNMNRGITKGCGAGVFTASVNVDGDFTPCRHLDLPEKYPTIMEYWQNSPTLEKLRKAFDRPEGKCRDCDFRPNCVPCMAMNQQPEIELVREMKICPIYKKTVANPGGGDEAAPAH